MAVLKTSETHPLEVSFLPKRGTHLRGRIGGTFCPGKHDPAARSGPWKRDLDLDLLRLRFHHGVKVLVCLLEDHELQDLHVPDLAERAALYKIELLRFPMVDGGVPNSRPSHASLIERILERARSGKSVVVFCKAGLGRTGLILATTLVAAGFDADAAIRAVRRARDERAIETGSQESAIHMFATKMLSRRISGNR